MVFFWYFIYIKSEEYIKEQVDHISVSHSISERYSAIPVILHRRAINVRFDDVTKWSLPDKNK